MSRITTHVLDLARGRPAKGVPVSLHEKRDGEWTLVGSGITDDDGRLRTLLPDSPLVLGTHYRLTFDTQTYFTAQSLDPFYPDITVTFVVRDPIHHHVPILLSPFGYSTYRGS